MSSSETEVSLEFKSGFGLRSSGAGSSPKTQAPMPFNCLSPRQLSKKVLNYLRYKPTNYNRDGDYYCRIHTGDNIVRHYSQTRFKRFKSTRRIWLNNVEKPEKNKREDCRPPRRPKTNGTGIRAMNWPTTSSMTTLPGSFVAESFSVREAAQIPTNAIANTTTNSKAITP